MKPSEMLPVDLNAYIITKEPQSQTWAGGQHGDHGAQHNKKQTAFVKSQIGWKKNHRLQLEDPNAEFHLRRITPT